MKKWEITPWKRANPHKISPNSPQLEITGNAKNFIKSESYFWFGLFSFFRLVFSFSGCILKVLSIMAAANWKLFAFYGKFVRNRPSKKRFCQPHRWIVSSEIVPFFLHSLAGCSYLHCGWQALGRASDEVQFWSIRLFYYPIPSFIHAIHWRLRLSFEFLCCFAANK